MWSAWLGRTQSDACRARSRRSSAPPSSSSSFCTARVSAGWVTLQASAARVKLQGVGEGKKVAYLMHFHGDALPPPVA